MPGPVSYPTQRGAFPAGHAVSAVILAAGMSTRLGRLKPLEKLGGQTLVERSVGLFRSAGVSDISVVLGFRAEAIRAAGDHLPVRWVPNPQYPGGMFSSVLAGIRRLPAACRAFFIHPVDIPLVRPATVQTLRRIYFERNVKILYPVFSGQPGHPPLIDIRLAPDILNWEGPEGLQGFLNSRRDLSESVPVMDKGVLLDLDTPEDSRLLAAKLHATDVPAAEECRVLMEEIQKLPEAVVRHCGAVARVAKCLARAVNRKGGGLDVDLTFTAALVHDAARMEKGHAEAGARLLRDLGFPKLAAVVAVHMDIAVDDRAPVHEGEIVYLADKLLSGDRIVDLALRFQRKMEKYGQDPESAAAIEQRRRNAYRIKAKIENAAGCSLEEILHRADIPGDPSLPAHAE